TPTPHIHPLSLHDALPIWMRALLVLFLTSTTGEFGWSKHDANVLYGWYTGLVYATGILGGWIADRWLGTHRAIIVGSVFIASGRSEEHTSELQSLAYLVCR